MTQARVALISKDSKLCRLIRAELMLMNIGMDSYNQSLPQGEIENYIAMIYDGDLPNTLAGIDVPIKIAVVREGADHPYASSGFTHILKLPFRMSEFRRILLDSRGTEKVATAPKRFQSEKYIYANGKEQYIIISNKKIKLTHHEFTILRLLCNADGRIVGRDELTKELGAEDGNIADVYICHLRKKLEAPYGIKIIYTVRQKGYMTTYKLIQI